MQVPTMMLVQSPLKLIVQWPGAAALPRSRLEWLGRGQDCPGPGFWTCIVGSSMGSGHQGVQEVTFSLSTALRVFSGVSTEGVENIV